MVSDTPKPFHSTSQTDHAVIDEMNTRRRKFFEWALKILDPENHRHVGNPCASGPNCDVSVFLSLSLRLHLVKSQISPGPASKGMSFEKLVSKIKHSGAIDRCNPSYESCASDLRKNIVNRARRLLRNGGGLELEPFMWPRQWRRPLRKRRRLE